MISSHEVSRRLPLVGLILAVGLLAYSARSYPDGYHWKRVTVSLLCAPTLASGGLNPVRWVAIGGLLLLCVSLAFLFQRISETADTRSQRKTIQIAGIGSMVYAALTATPMHNLMVTIALLFFVVSVLAILRMLLYKQRISLFLFGLICCVFKLAGAWMYYSNSLTPIWGLIQTLNLFLMATWLVAVYWTLQGNRATRTVQPKFQ